MKNEPKITFLFPFRWLTDDKEFLKENIKRMMEKEAGKEIYELLSGVGIYKVEILYQYKKPIANFPLTLLQVKSILKPFFTNGKCIGLTFNYKQHTSKTMLPLLDFRIYFN
jgi:hypothetical protein